MTQRERYIKSLLFEKVDKVAFMPGGPRESTLKRWRREGLPEGVGWQDYFFEKIGVKNDRPLSPRVRFSVSFNMMPAFEEKVLQHENGHYIVRDFKGAVVEIADNFDVTYLRSAKDFVTRKWHKFPVENEKDWLEMKKRYDADSPERLAGDIENAKEQLKKRDYYSSIAISGPFWQLRDWCGFENLCIFMATRQDFVQEMASFWKDFVLAVLGKIRGCVYFDSVIINEDMAYKEKSMISPSMARKYLMPAWSEWAGFLKEIGCKIIILDSDGFVGELIPLWIEAGINCCVPVEVAAGNDIVAYRKLYGKRMAYKGGIDKRSIAKGGIAMENELLRVVPPLLKERGYIPGCDHGVPSDISWQNFLEYGKFLAKLEGWL